ncbi:Multidrug resistance protein ABC transporter [Phytophthora megakarya]|uniref:Multidrug resistance protein ABC transporter n=1 Tax=Phytophthora megakarya TaxID=4795 RepID=A0A225WWR6_9STRA|nr:Multidrug resistance protein ABC transporter [Phytophthora megakarya]
MLSTEETDADFDKKQIMILRMISASVPPDIIHQILTADVRSDIWDALCDLFENKVNKTVKVHRIRRLVTELWNTKLIPDGDANLHLSKMFNLRTELMNMQYTLEDVDMVDIVASESGRASGVRDFEVSVSYGADTSVYTPTKVREHIRAAASRQTGFHCKRGPGTGQNMGQKSAGNKADAKGKPENQQQQKLTFGSKGSKKGRKCYACDSGDHIRANCPQNAINAEDNG